MGFPYGALLGDSPCIQTCKLRNKYEGKIRQNTFINLSEEDMQNKLIMTYAHKIQSFTPKTGCKIGNLS